MATAILFNSDRRIYMEKQARQNDLGFKGKLGESRLTLERHPFINKNFWLFRFFLIRLGCLEI